MLARGSVGAQQRTGPAIIESYDTTIVVPPQAAFFADAIGNVIIELEAHGDGASP